MDNNQLYNEKDLLYRMADSDETAFAGIIARYGTIVHAQLTLYVKDLMVAEEVTQDIMMTLWANRRKLPVIENFPGYVYTITRNRIRKILMQKAAAMEELADDVLNRLPGASEYTIEHKQLSAIVREGIRQLPPRRKQVFELSRLEELSHEEVAQRLNVSRNAVKGHIKAALVFLRKYIHQAQGDALLLFLLWSVSNRF